MLGKKHTDESDMQLVVGLQAHDRTTESRFFESMQTYFNAHFRKLFFDEYNKDEIFQTALIKLWTEIENRRITVLDGKICRQSRDGVYMVMSASIRTFFLAFAKNEFREQLRNLSDDNLSDLTNISNEGEVLIDADIDEDEMKVRIVDECLVKMSPHCLEIIRLFYYEEKSLDDILSDRAENHVSKGGLRTAKSKCLSKLRENVKLIFEKFHLD